MQSSGKLSDKIKVKNTFQGPTTIERGGIGITDWKIQAVHRRINLESTFRDQEF